MSLAVPDDYAIDDVVADDCGYIRTSITYDILFVRGHNYLSKA